MMGLQKLLDSTPARLAGRSSDLLQLVALAFTTLAAVYGAGITWAAIHGASLPLVVGAAALFAVVAATTFYVKCIHTPKDSVIEELDGLLVVARVHGEGGRIHHRYTYNRQQQIRAIRPNLRIVGIRSHWSGQSRTVEEAASLFPEHRLLDGAIAEEDGRIHRWVYLLGPIARNRRVRVGIKQIFEDAYGPMKPYYRESGEDRKVHRLSVRVRFACDDAPVEAWQVVWKRSRSGSTRQEVARDECRPIIHPDTGSVVYELLKSKPDPDCAYGISWRWPMTSAHCNAGAPLHEEPTPMTRSAT
ncbi:hypothetical protein [Micromonospora chersina]|uniref:hypothetical protein n=1 Tax=Micromonospora chersina TaxID=47854 RepID=UPI00372257F7